MQSDSRVGFDLFQGLLRRVLPREPPSKDKGRRVGFSFQSSPPPTVDKQTHFDKGFGKVKIKLALRADGWSAPQAMRSVGPSSPLSSD